MTLRDDARTGRAKGHKRGPGRPPRPDGLTGDEARAARGIGRLTLRIPRTSLAILDEIATSLGMTRGAAIVYLLSYGIEHGIAPRAAAQIRPANPARAQEPR